MTRTLPRRILPIGERVIIDAGLPSERKGVVVGRCTAHRHGLTPVSLLAIELAEGFYDQARITYTSITLAHTDNVTSQVA